LSRRRGVEGAKDQNVSTGVNPAILPAAQLGRLAAFSSMDI
jgi:hypothetical protein